MRKPRDGIKFLSQVLSATILEEDYIKREIGRQPEHGIFRHSELLSHGLPRC